MTDFGQLRDIRADDLEEIRAWRNHPSIRSRMYSQHEIDLEEHLSWWAEVRWREDQKHLLYEYRGLAAGIVSFTRIDPVSDNASWGFYAAPCAGKGLGACVEFLALEYGFNTLGVHKLYGEVLASNRPSLNLQQRFGFRLEGTFREHYKNQGEFIDVYRFGLMAREWSARKAAVRQRIAAAIDRYRRLAWRTQGEGRSAG